MVGRAALVPGGHGHDGFPALAHGVYVPLKQGIACMGAVVGAVAEVDAQGHIQRQGLVGQVFYRPHDFCGAGKGLVSRVPQLYHNQACLRGHARFRAAAGGPVPGGDTRHRRPMARRVHGGNDGKRNWACQSLVNLDTAVFHAAAKARRGQPHQGLVPEIENPGGSVGIPEVGMGVINAGVNNAHNDPGSRQSKGVGTPDWGDAGAFQTVPQHKGEDLGQFNVLNLRKTVKLRQSVHRQGDNGVIGAEQFNIGAKQRADT
ncbi:hypothetical protein SDC9_94879 [bioreactor metagenome]|uniref:Uncharacterized protein n=1 Tax=bioreactor metagenome TaxID=1076179 RepID=A0A645A5E0_9ZZZZ